MLVARLAPETPSIVAWCIRAKQRDRAVLDPLDDPELPQRPRPVELTAGDAADDVHQLVDASPAPGTAM